MPQCDHDKYGIKFNSYNCCFSTEQRVGCRMEGVGETCRWMGYARHGHTKALEEGYFFQ
jgi:hypothetical protein